MSKDAVRGRSNRFVLTTLTSTHIAQHFYAGAPIVFQNIRSDLGLNYTDIGIMTGTSSILGGFLQIIYSIASRRFPRRLLLGAANLMISLGCLLMGSADRFLMLLVGNVTAGIGQAGQHPMGTSIIARKFGSTAVGRALSVFYGLGYIGNIFGPIMLSTVAVLLSWRFSLFFLATIPLITGLAALYYLHGEPAGEITVTETSRGSLLSDIVSSLRVKGAIFVLVAQSFIVGGTGMGVLITWVPQFLQDPLKGLGLGIVEAGAIGAISTVGGAIGTIIVGHLADRFGHLRMAMACISSTIVMVYLLTLYRSFTPILVVHLFALGVTTYSITSILQAHLAAISTSVHRDLLLGLYFTFGFGVSSLWSTVMGRLIDTYSFAAVWTMMSLLGLIALFMLLNAYRPRPKPENTAEE